MKRFVRSFAALALLLLLPHCPPARTPEPIEEPSASDAAVPLPIVVDATQPLQAGAIDASTTDAEVTDAGVTSSLDAAGDAASPLCSDTVLGQSLKSASCTDDAQCALRTPGCCAPCGEVRPDQLRAVSIQDDLVCNGVGCPKCASRLPPGFAARCIKKRCNVVQTTCEKASACPKIRKPKLLGQILDAKLATCRRDDECALGTKNCCNCGLSGDGAVVAYSRRTPYQCAGGHQCPDCVDHGPDPALTAVCVAGRCRVKDSGLDSECLIDLREGG